MKRTFSITLAVLAAVCLFRASQLLNTAHAQNGQGQGPVKHRTNPENEPDAASPSDSNGPETNRGNRPSVGMSLTTGGTGVVTPPITYHGGALIQTPVIYIIWYGNWNQTNGSDNAAGQQIVRDFAGNIGRSSYFQLKTTHSTGGYNITGNVTFGGETPDTGSQGTRLTDTKVFNVVNNAIAGGKLPYDADGVYFVVS